MKIKKKVFHALAVLLCVFLLSSCKTSEPTGGGNTEKTLIWHYIGTPTSEDAAVYAKANEIIKEKLDFTVEFLPINTGDYTKKMQLKASSSEAFDICFTSNWSFNMQENAAKGAFLELDSLLDKNAPKLKELIPEHIMNACRVGGKLYAVPNYQVSFKQTAFVFNKNLVEKYNLKSQIDNVKDMEDFTPILKVIAENEPNIVPSQSTPALRINTKEKYYEEPITYLPIGIDRDLNVLDLRKDPHRQLNLKYERLALEWNKMGFFHPDVGINKNLGEERSTGKFFMFNDTIKPGLEMDMETRYGYPVYVKALGDAFINTESVQVALTSINRASKHPEEAMQLLELINSDKELFNILLFGLEGKQYVKTGENSIKLIEESKYRNTAWVFANQFNAYLLPGQSETVWDETIQMNNEATPSKLLGFMVDTSNIKTEVANIKSVTSMYNSILKFGLADDLEKLHAEIDEKVEKDILVVMEELEKQIKAFKQEN